MALEEQLMVTSKLNDDHAELLTRGMETMGGVLGNIIRGLDERLSMEQVVCLRSFARNDSFQ